MAAVRLEDLAIVHSGDKGDTCNLGLVPYSPEAGDWLRDNLTPEHFARTFGSLVKGRITIHHLPGTGCLNVVMEGALGGGVTRSLCLDPHGKTWSYRAAEMALDVPDDVLRTIARRSLTHAI